MSHQPIPAPGLAGAIPSGPPGGPSSSLGNNGGLGSARVSSEGCVPIGPNCLPMNWGTLPKCGLQNGQAYMFPESLRTASHMAFRILNVSPSCGICSRSRSHLPLPAAALLRCPPCHSWQSLVPRRSPLCLPQGRKSAAARPQLCLQLPRHAPRQPSG